MSAVLAIASPRRIKASHRRRRKVTSGHFVQRYYDPQIGRFLSNDPVSTDSNTGAAFNRYNYANNNPYRFSDPDGRFPTPNPEFFAGAAMGVIDSVTESASSMCGETVSVFGGADGDIAAGGYKFGHALGIATQVMAPAHGSGAVATVEKAATASERAKTIQSALSPRTQRAVTTAVAETKEGVRVVGSSEGSLRPAQRAAMQPGEVAAKGAARTHAEVNAVNGARAQGLTPTSVSPSRPPCANCQAAMKDLNIPIKDR